jgi:hypothetical protein
LRGHLGTESLRARGLFLPDANSAQHKLSISARVLLTIEHVSRAQHLRKRNEVMRNRTLAISGLALAGILAALAVWSFSSSGELVAGRYYLRGRTSNFYNRATPRVHYAPQIQSSVQPVTPVAPVAPPKTTQIAPVSQELAGRYYLRGRTKNFYNRASVRSTRLIG